jgi:hypothetical protein
MKSNNYKHIRLAALLLGGLLVSTCAEGSIYDNNSSTMQTTTAPTVGACLRSISRESIRLP